MTGCHIPFLGQCDLDLWPSFKNYCVPSISLIFFEWGIEEFAIIGFYLYHVTSAGQSSNWTTSSIYSNINWLLISLYRTSTYRLKFLRKKTRQLSIEESDKTACHYGHLWLHLYTAHSVIRYILFCAGPNCIRFFNECPGALWKQ